MEKFIKGAASPGWTGTELQNQNPSKMLSKTPLLNKSKAVAYPAATSKLTASLSNATGREAGSTTNTSMQ